MDNSTIQTSFIPKQTISASPLTNRPSSTGTGMGLVTLISFILLLISIVAAGGTYLYRAYLLSQIYSACNVTSEVQTNSDLLGLSGDIEKQCGLYASLAELRRRLDSERLSKMERLDTKMKLASQILSTHQTLVPVFDLLSTTTLKTIRYTKFDIESGQVTLSGVASGYDDIAVQSNVLNSIPTIKNALFSNLSVNQQGGTTFDLTFDLDAKQLEYKNFFNTASALSAASSTI